MLNIKTPRDVDVTGKRVLVRCDFNVPMSDDGTIADMTRINESLPTIKHLLGQGAKVILCSHRGRPKGKGFNEKYSLAPVAKALDKKLGRHVAMAKDVIGPDAHRLAQKLKNGEVMLLENVRFEEGEEKNDPEFARELASFADIYVNDAFGTAHRAHASTAGVAEFLPAYCGFLISKEIDAMGSALENPKRPFIAILGGAKVSDKIGVINSLIEKVDTLIIGGGMAYTFIKATGGSIGDSLCENDKVEFAGEIIERARKKGVELLLPIDTRAADRFAPDANVQVVNTREIPDGWMGLDIGPQTVKAFSEKVESAGTVIWNGPMGVFEFEAFSQGTYDLIQAVADSRCVSIIGGGDTASAVVKMGFADRVTHISTGGGATLEFLEGRPLPGIVCLEKKH